MDADQFVYDNLTQATGCREIRLLDLIPGSWASDIECNLWKVALESCPPYEGLSYVWGDPHPPKQILVCGRAFSITKNLHDALFRLRDAKEHRLLWVDAICINQQSVAEKNAQIQLMRHIYENAVCVNVFLGDIGDHHPALRIGLSLVPKLLRAAEVAERIHMTSSQDDHNYFLHLKNLKRVALPPPDPFRSEYEAFGEILSRQWFRRVWVLQELAVSKRAQVICADEHVSWTDLVKAIKFAAFIGIIPYYIDPFITIWPTAVAKLQLEVQRSVHHTLLDLLIRFRHHSATDPRDKIFALCGLVGEDLPNIIPDYELSTFDAYKTVAATIIEMTNSLDILKVPRVVGASIAESLPSWVPDWSGAHKFFFPLLDIAGDEVRYDFCATKNTQTRITIDRSTSCLKLEGMCVDQVKENGNAMDKDWRLNAQHGITYSTLGNDVKFDNLARIAQSNAAEQVIFAQWEKIAAIRSRTNYPTGEAHLDVYRKTLVANHLPEGESASKASFAAWHRGQRLIAVLTKLGRTSAQQMAAVIMQAVYRTLRANFNGKFQQLMQPILGRRLARTENGYLALVPDIAQVGDQIWLLKGANVPIVLRRDSLCQHYQLVGASYVHGIMNGETFDESACREVILC